MSAGHIRCLVFLVPSGRAEPVETGKQPPFVLSCPDRASRASALGRFHIKSHGHRVSPPEVVIHLSSIGPRSTLIGHLENNPKQKIILMSTGMAERRPDGGIPGLALVGFVASGLPNGLYAGRLQTGCGGVAMPDYQERNDYDPLMAGHLFDPNEWQKSFLSEPNGGNCVEVNVTADKVGVRDSKLMESPVFVFDSGEWRAFLDAVKEGQFDPPN